MRIAMVTSNLHATSACSGKAIYSHTAALANGMVAKGHDTHLFAAEESKTSATLHSVCAALHKAPIDEATKRHYVSLLLSRCYEFARCNADVVHAHFSLVASFFASLIETPTLVSVHSPIEDRLKPLLAQVRGVRYISFSLAQRRQMPELNWYANIYHGVDTNLFAFNQTPHDYFLFLGRLTRDKGPHHAIRAAEIAGAKLRIAGASYPAEGYWQSDIEPHINGTNVRYVGEASQEAKIPLLQGARALLFPTEVEEAFGYSMIEAMACGTPVIAFGNGSVPEIVKHGETGFIVKNAEEMAEAIGRIGEIDRAAVRRRAERYFSEKKMVDGYEKVYARAVADEAWKKEKRC